MFRTLKTAAIVLTTRTWITYVQLAGAVVLLAAGELAELAPDGSENVVKWLLWLGTVLTETVTLVTTHTRVPKSARGLTVPDDVTLTLYATASDGRRYYNDYDLEGRLTTTDAVLPRITATTVTRERRRYD